MQPMPLVLSAFVAIAPFARAQTEAELHSTNDAAELPPVPPPPEPRVHPVHDLAMAGATSERGARPVGLLTAGAATVAAMFGLEFVGLLIATSSCGGFLGSSSCLETGFAAATVVTGAAALALVPLVVWATGASLGGHGGYGWTFLGHLLGALAWFVVPAVALITEGELTVPAILFAGVAEATGATIGYELSTAR